MNEGLEGRLERRQLLGESLDGKVLHAERLVDDEAGEDLLVLDHQDSPLLAQGRQLAAEETAQIDDRQQAPAHVGHPPNPALDAGQLGIARLVQNFADFADGRDEQPRTHAKTDATPALRHLLLGWQARGMAAAELVDFEQSLERSHDVGHAGLGLWFRVVVRRSRVSRPELRRWSSAKCLRRSAWSGSPAHLGACPRPYRFPDPWW
ncbi:hypothetical protein D3C78_1253640 [compost metagenome]